MNVIAFRHFFAYHFAENHHLWDRYIMQLSQEQFIQGDNYSHGSVRNQIVHLMSVDYTWFSGLTGREIPAPLDPADYADRSTIRAQWNRIENDMRTILDGLRDDMLDSRPFGEGEDKDLMVWQVLLQVVNHGTDHRAQILRLLNDLGMQTTSQDYIFYVYENPL